MPGTFSLEDILLAVLILVGILCIVFILKALDNLKKEQKALGDCQTKIRQLRERNRWQAEENQRKGETEPDAYSTLAGMVADVEKSSAAVQKFIDSAGTDPGALNTGYVSDRLFAIIKSVSSDNLVRKAPPLTDLHELTIQKERSSISSATFRILAPSILVLGILGTLLGVHERLEETVSGQGDITALAEALVPGALAVLFTVLVMIFRGFYNKKQTGFIAKLDEYTLTTLLPLFQPQAQLAADEQKLRDALSGAEERLKELGNLMKDTAYLNKIVQQFDNGCLKAAETMYESLCHLKVIWELAYANHATACQLQATIQKSSQTVSSQERTQQEMLNALIVQLEQTQNYLFLRYSEVLALPFAQQLERTIWPAMSTRQYYEYTVEELQQRTSRTFSLPDDFFPAHSGYAGYQHKVQQCNAMFQHLPDNFSQYQENVYAINTKDDEIDRTVLNLLERISVWKETNLPGLQVCYAELNDFIREQHLLLSHSLDKLKENLKTAQLDFREENVSRKNLMNTNLHPDGWKGFTLKLREKILQWRKAYRSKRGTIILALILLVLYLWFITVTELYSKLF